MDKNKFDHTTCRHNDGNCSTKSCADCPMNPSRPQPKPFKNLFNNPPGMACVETVEDAARDAIEYFNELYMNCGDFKASMFAARLENALERSGVSAP